MSRPIVTQDRRRRPARAALAAAVAVLTATLMAVFAGTAQAATTPVPLGTAESFAVLAGSEMTNTGPSVVTGDLGVHPGTAMTGFPPGTAHGTQHSADALAGQAKADLVAAYNNAAGRPATELAAVELGGRTLTDGVYHNGTLGLTGTLTLDGQGLPGQVWIFQADSTLITASNSSVSLINGADACNVFWKIGSSATLGTGTDFVGTVMAMESITVQTGASVEGRVLARNGAVTLDNNVIGSTGCPGSGVPPTTTTTTPPTTTTTEPTTTTGETTTTQPTTTTTTSETTTTQPTTTTTQPTTTTGETTTTQPTTTTETTTTQPTTTTSGTTTTQPTTTTRPTTTTQPTTTTSETTTTQPTTTTTQPTTTTTQPTTTTSRTTTTQPTTTTTRPTTTTSRTTTARPTTSTSGTTTTDQTTTDQTTAPGGSGGGPGGGGSVTIPRGHPQTGSGGTADDGPRATGIAAGVALAGALAAAGIAVLRRRATDPTSAPDGRDDA